MTDIKSNLAENIGNTFKVSKNEPSAQVENETKENRQDIYVSDLVKSSRISGSENHGTDSAGKKRFPNFRKMVNGFRSTRKEKSYSDKISVIGDSSNSAHLNKEGKMFGKSNISTIGRMWNSLFPNKESPEMMTTPTEKSNMIKERSTKTLGRLFGARNVKESIENDLVGIPKSSTLGRKISQSIRQFKMAAPVPNIAQDNVNDSPVMSPTTSLEHKSTTPTPV